MPLVLIVVLSYFTRFYPSKTKKKTTHSRGPRLSAARTIREFFFLGFLPRTETLFGSD